MSSTSLAVLFIEDSEDDMLLLLAELEGRRLTKYGPPALRLVAG